ncbi:MAG: HD domain-containing protein [Treponema sp.]|nr:HD domain-containing protein [Treponema sp.]
MSRVFFMGLIISMIVALGACMVTLSVRRATEAQKFLVTILSSVILYLLGYYIYYSGNTVDFLIMGKKLQFVGAFCLFINLFMVFQQVYNVKSSVISMIPLTIWFVFLCLVLFMTNNKLDFPIAHWFYKTYNLVIKRDGQAYLYYEPGWAYTAFLVSLGFVLLVTVIVFIRALYNAWKHNYKISVAFFFISVVPQTLIYIKLITDINKHFLPVAPLMAGAAGCLATVLVWREKFSNLYDLSYIEMMNSLTSPLFVLDNAFFVRRVNKAAKILYPEYKNLKDSSYHRLKAAAELQNIILPPLHETVMDQGYLTLGRQTFNPELHRIGKGRHIYGYLIILNDITEQHAKNTELEQLTTKLTAAMRTSKNRTVNFREKLLSGALQFVRDKDVSTADHMKRTTNYTFIIARELRRLGLYADVLTDAYMETLCQVAPLHDIGKFYISGELLHKVDLNEDELRTMKAHVNMGAQIIDRMVTNNPDDLYYRLAREVALYHHEWWDGSGYNMGLKGEEIPLSARIVAVADVFDKIAYRHATRKIYNFEEAVNIVDSYSEKQFDPLVIKAFDNAKNRLKELYDQTYQNEVNR